MSLVASYSAMETSERLIPLLREYSQKLSDLYRELSACSLRVANRISEADAKEAARLICLFSALERQIAEMSQLTSGMLEHSDIEHIIWIEMKLRLNEIESHMAFCRSKIEEVKGRLASKPEVLNQARNWVEKIGYKAPF